MAPRQSTTVSSSADSSTQDVDSLNDSTENGVKDPNVADVLCGRGGNINTHPGNENYRKLIERHKRVYLTARFKKEKRLITDSIIEEVRRRGGKFLMRDAKTNLWHQVPIEKSRDKTSQALRENAPKIRDKIEKENQAVRDARRREEEAANAREAQIEMDYYGSPDRQRHHHSSSGHAAAAEQQYYPTPESQYYVSPDKNSYHRTHGYYGSPIRQQYHEGWSNQNYEYNRYPPYSDQPLRERNSRANEETPNYNNTKSFVETAVETVTGAFTCPTKLEDFYSNSQAYDQPQSHYPPSAASEAPGQYSGQKRTYSSPQRSYQRRDDHNHWRHHKKYYYDDDNKSPVYHELPRGRSSGHSSSPSNQQRYCKRNKRHPESTPYSQPMPQPERATSSSSSTGLWNPFPFTSPFSWNNEPNSPSPGPVLNVSSNVEEGQEVQLIPRLQSMTMECDGTDNQPNVSSYDNGNKVYSSNKEGLEVRTPPPTDEDPKSLDGGWALESGGCHAILLSHLFGDNDDTTSHLNVVDPNRTTSNSNVADTKNPNEDGKISPVLSIDMNGSLASLDGTENNSTTDLNGASLVNVFSDGGNTTSTDEKSKASKFSSDASFNFGDSILSGDIVLSS